MGEAIITRGCYGGGSDWDQGTLAPTTGIYIQNCEYLCTHTGNYIVTCVGGGGSGGGILKGNTSSGAYNGGGGGSGYFSTNTIFLNNGEVVPIIANNGITTSFGVYCAGNAGGKANYKTAGTGGNNGKNGSSYGTEWTAGGHLWVNPSNPCEVSYSATTNCTQKLAYGSGGNGRNWNSLIINVSTGNIGNSGCCAIIFKN